MYIGSLAQPHGLGLNLTNWVLCSLGVGLTLGDTWHGLNLGLGDMCFKLRFHLA
jgi:hypothetical protein